MIMSPLQIAQNNKRIRMLIAGHPGIGKTTLALSAPRPLHIDADYGLDRVAARHRHSYIQPKTYKEILDDLQPENLTDFDTLVIDTGGQLLKFMGDYAKQTDSKNARRDGALSLQGYGYIGREFERLMNHCYYTLQKHVVVVFHAKEEKDGDTTRLRLLVEGQTKDNVWQPMDLGGFVEIENGKRIISFANNERHFGKYCHGIGQSYTIPDLENGRPNTFLTDLFTQINKNIAEEAQNAAFEQAAYEAAMDSARDIIAKITDAETATGAYTELLNLDHQLTSRAESSQLLSIKARLLGLRFDREASAYIPNHAQPA